MSIMEDSSYSWPCSNTFAEKRMLRNLSSSPISRCSRFCEKAMAPWILESILKAVSKSAASKSVSAGPMVN